MAALSRSPPSQGGFVPGEDIPDGAPKSAPCLEQVALPARSDDGIARLRIVSPCRKGRALKISTDEATFEAAFDDSGVLTASVPIFHDPASLRWQDPDGQDHEERTRFPNIQRVLKVALLWTGDLTLSLRINEAPSPLPGAKCPWLRRGDTCRGLGRFEASLRASALNTHYEIYTLPEFEPVRGGRLPYRVYFDSRVTGTAQAKATFCGEGRWAEPAFALWVLKNGIAMRDTRLSRFARKPCDEVGSEPSYDQNDVLLGP